MRYSYIRPFIDAAQRVLEQVLSDRTVAGDMRLSSAPLVSRGVTTIVGVTGEGEGRVIFDMTPEIALSIASTMNGESLADLNGLGQDTLAELASMITGRAVTMLNDEGHHLSVSPPTLFTGNGVTISMPQIEALVVPLETPLGEVVVNVAIATG